MTDAQMQDMIAAANAPAPDTDAPLFRTATQAGLLPRDLWIPTPTQETTGEVHFNDVARYAVPERLQGHETLRNYTGQATAGIGHAYLTPDPALSAWCSDTSHTFACRHEPVCRCGQTQRVVSYGL